MADTLLNPEALAAAGNAVFENVLGFDKTRATAVAKATVSAYLTALPEMRAEK